MSKREQKKPYATVEDDRTMCLSHGGHRLRGGFTVYVGTEVAWTENDSYQTAEDAEAHCQRLARLLQGAYNAGRKAGRKHA